MRPRELVTLVALLSACESSTGGPDGYRSGRIAFQNMQAMAAVSPPFVTILDSVDLAVLRASDSTRLLFLGRRVSSIDTVATFDLHVPVGPVVLRGRLLTSQGNRAVLSQGTFDTQVDRNGFSVTIPMVARAPILLVAPDTVQYVAARARDSIFVHNRGTDSLVWGINVSPALNQTECQPAPCMVITPSSGVVYAGGVRIVRLERIIPGATVFTLTFSSPLGQVPVVVRRAP